MSYEYQLCPACGKQTAWEDELCGPCEEARRKDEDRMEKQEQEEFCRKYGGYYDRDGNWMEGEE